MRRVHALALVTIVAMIGAAGPASAHHSGAMFEETKTVTMEGVVKEFQYTNPHSWLLVDVKGKDGKVTTWGFEAEGPTTLQRAGIRPSEFPVGTKLTITGRPMKDGRPGGGLGWAKLANGTFVNPSDGGCDGSDNAIAKWKGWMAKGYTSSAEATKAK